MRRRCRRWVRKFAAGLLVCCAACSTQPSSIDEHFFRGNTVWGTPPAPDFALVDQHGKPFRLSEQRGSVVLLFFGYVYCPDV